MEETPKLPKDFESRLMKSVKRNLFFKDFFDSVVGTLSRLFIFFLELIAIVFKPKSP